jgi:hypothetical protein
LKHIPDICTKIFNNNFKFLAISTSFSRERMVSWAYWRLMTQTGIALGSRPEINWCPIALENFFNENISNKNKKNRREGVLV